jgi:ribosomal protein S18 acetylase RimI-like enzyme
MAVSEVATIKEVEVLSEAEWRRLFAMLQDAFVENAPHIDPPSSLEQLSLGDIKRMVLEDTMLVAWSGGGIVGCAFVSDRNDHLYLGRLAVSAQHRRGGIATALVRHAFMKAEELGLPAVQLQTRVELTNNHAAFERMGFTKIGEEAHPGFDRPTSIRMECRL